jgi:hypothetical protein
MLVLMLVVLVVKLLFRKRRKGSGRMGRRRQVFL